MLLKAILFAFIVYFGRSEETLIGNEVDLLSALPPEIDYSLDFSFPVHHLNLVNKFGSHSRKYEGFIDSCITRHGSKCTLSENYRRYHNLHVPKNKINYTDVGFLKMKAPTAVFDALHDLFHANKHKAVKENWSHGKTLLNHWESHPYIINWER